jgi:hypothetical protein
MVKIWYEEILTELRSAGGEVIGNGNVVFINGNKFTFVSAGSEFIDKDPDSWVIHEDIYRLRPIQLISRIRSMTGMNILRIHGRRTKVTMLSRQTAKEFCAEHHLMGFGGGHVFTGLEFSEKIVAVAVFSKTRWMKYEKPPYRSTELVRYCSSQNVHVTGGLDKLIKYFLKTNATDDIVTYIDKEWSAGAGYLKIGFEVAAETSPITFAVSKRTFRRKLSEDANSLTSTQWLVSNRGNLKLRLKVN